MNAIVELVQPVKKVRKPPEVAIAELKAEIRDLKRELKTARRHATHMLASMRLMDHRMRWLMEHASFEDRCTCTPTRADFLRAIERD
jgi:hypothetical protein